MNTSLTIIYFICLVLLHFRLYMWCEMKNNISQFTELLLFLFFLQMQQMCNVEVRQFNFTKYPKHVSTIDNRAWKIFALRVGTWGILKYRPMYWIWEPEGHCLFNAAVLRTRWGLSVLHCCVENQKGINDYLFNTVVLRSRRVLSLYKVYL